LVISSPDEFLVICILSYRAAARTVGTCCELSCHMIMMILWWNTERIRHVITPRAI